MTPEDSIRQAVETACPACGHWPYTRSADVFCGWRPEGDRMSDAANRPVRCMVSYDLVLCYRRGAEHDAQRTRFALYDALRRAGWRIRDNGPEAYTDKTDMFYWPIVVERGFGMDDAGQPYDLRAARETETVKEGLHEQA